MNLILNSDAILQSIESVGATSSKNEKIAMLKALSSNNLLMEVLRCTYDPTISYGIRAVPNRTAATDDGAQFDANTWSILDRMAKRDLTGNAMHAEVQAEMNRLTALSAELFKRIMLKDMRAGFSEETCNKVWPSLVPDFPYMRCALPKDAKFDEWNWSEGVISQEKADGMFCNVNHEDSDTVFIYSRAGSMFPMEKFEKLSAAVSKTFPKHTQSHGEMLVLRDGQVLPREIGNGVLTSVLKGGDFAENEEPIFLVWDQISLDSVVPKGKFSIPQSARLALLIQALKANPSDSIKLIETRIVHSLEEAYQHYAELLSQGKEGTIIKKRTAIWKDGTSKEQIKLKLEFESDLEIIEIVPGKANGKNEGRAGSLKCRSQCGKLIVDVAIKGEKMRDEVDAAPDTWLGNIMKVTANMIMKPSESNENHSLFLPRFSESFFRTDKKVADDLDRIFANEAMAKLGASIAVKKAA